MHIGGRAAILVFFLLILLCGINFKYFSASYIPGFIIDSIPIENYQNDTIINKFINEEAYDIGEPPSRHNYTWTGRNNQSRFQNYINIDYDLSRKAKQLWQDDPQCSKYSVRFGLGITGAWLLSFPRSGNTWTRYLLEAATGLFTGSVYNSKYLKSLGYLGESDPVWWLSTIITKTHSLQPLINHPQRPVVIIIRNPARSILSYWNYRNVEDSTKKLTASIDKAFYATAGFHLFVREKMEKWRTTYAYALKNATRLHVVYYEKLRDNPLRETLGMLRFLGVRPDKNRFYCLSRHLEGNAKGAQREDDPYTQAERKQFAKNNLQVDDLLRERGFSSLPDYRLYDT